MRRYARESLMSRTGHESSIYSGVRAPESVTFQPGCVVGIPPRGRDDGELETFIGDGSIIRAFAVIYAGARLGANVQVGHGALIREGNVIGDGASVGSYSVLEGACQVGAGARIHSRCFLESTTVGKDAFLGPGVIVTDDPHPPCPKYVECGQGVTIEDRAKIGGGAVLLPGITIGVGALVGAGSVVTQDVPPGMVVAGNPATILKPVDALKCHAGLYSRVFEWEETL